jgi:DnaT DNA-binding domain
MSLSPEKYLSVSPQLAATLGLEEALLFQLFTEFQALMPDNSTLALEPQALLTLMPFWRDQDIRRISSSLQDKGVIDILSAPFGREPQFRLRLEMSDSPRVTPNTAANTAPRAAIATSWQPAPDVVAQLCQYGIPKQFIYNQVAEFVTYWSERGDPQYSWHSKFLKQVMRQWRAEESRSHKRSLSSTMTPDWQPSPDAVDILHRQAGIHVNFIEDAIPEFILYWSERGESRSTWNTDFVRHVKTQWAKFTATLEHDSTPRVIEKSWQPSEDLFEVLQLANIPREFATTQVPEFVLFWRENGQAFNSWNTKFLQHVKRQWARQGTTIKSSHERYQDTTENLTTRNRSLVADLTDRSWAN